MRSNAFLKLFFITPTILLIGGCNPTPPFRVNTGSSDDYPENFSVIAYYNDNPSVANEYPLHKITHFIYSFMILKGNKLDVNNNYVDQSLKKLGELKKAHPNLKIMLAFAGWNNCETCSEVFSDANNRKEFADSVKKTLIDYNLDGFDLDWEYPAVEGPPGHAFKPEDKQNFTELVRAIRTAFGNELILSFAAGGFPEYLENSVEWKKVMPLVDFVNIMSYDLYNSYSTTTGHHTPLYSTKSQIKSTDNAVQYILKQGIDSKKIIIGSAFYARVWENVEAEGDNILYQTATFKKAINYNEYDSFLTSDFKYFWDDDAKATYFYSAEQNLFASLEDPKSIIYKTEYAMNKKLGGIMFWQLPADRLENGLLKIISAVVSGQLKASHMR